MSDDNSTRVANELGAGNPEGARSAVRIVMTIAALEASIVTSSLLASQHIVGYAYSSDKEVVAYVNAMVPFVCLSVAADSLQGVLSGYILLTLNVLIYISPLHVISPITGHYTKELRLSPLSLIVTFHSICFSGYW